VGSQVQLLPGPPFTKIYIDEWGTKWKKV